MILRWIIIHGKWLGRELGYRTANMHIDPASTSLESGTYALRGIVRWQELTGVGVYIPQIETFESHFFDFDDDIYDLEIAVEPLYKIRENIRFDTLEALAEQIGKDVLYVKKVAAYHPFIAIAAMSKNRVIGNGNTIPWHIPEDFQHFKETTLGHPIIMGRKTFESIGRPLPGRENIVLTSSDEKIEWTTICHSIPELQHSLFTKNIEKAFICGGWQVYNSFFKLWLTNEVILSVVDMVIEGDTTFPEFEEAFKLISEEQRWGFMIQTWRKN